MAAMSTTLVTISLQGSTVQYALPSHTEVKPRVLVQSKLASSDKKRTSQSSLRFVMAAVDANGAAIPERDSVEIVVKRATYADGANLNAAFWTMFKEVVNSDEFTNNFLTGYPIKSL